MSQTMWFYNLKQVTYMTVKLEANVTQGQGCVFETYYQYDCRYLTKNNFCTARSDGGGGFRKRRGRSNKNNT